MAQSSAARLSKDRDGIVEELRERAAQPMTSQLMAAQVIDWNTAMTTKRQSAARTAKTCEQLSMELSAYFDGELDPADRAAIELHVSECEACSRKLEQMRKLRSALSSLSAGAPRTGSVLDMLRAELRSGTGDPSGGRKSN